MRSLISLLMIPFLVLGQSLPHSHAGSSVEQSSDHGARAHVHLAGGHSHDSRHEETSHHHDREADHSESVGIAETGVYCPPLDHDSDAVYLATSTSFTSRVVVADRIDLASDAARIYCRLGDEVQPKPGGRTAPPRRSAGVPIYLLVSSLRL